jgi:hypothetical protein
MALKPNVIFDAASHLWQVQVKDSQGNLRVQDSVASIEAMENFAATSVFLGLAKEAPNKRVAAVTLLSAIMADHITSLEAWRGNGDPKQPIPRELSGTFQRCEVKWFEKYMDPKHPEHDKFVNRLPTADGRGNILDTNGKPNYEARFDAFLTNTRKEPSYNNAKNVVLGFFSLLGRTPIGDDGRLIPPEVMAVMVRNARIIEQADTSYKGKLAVLYRVLVQGAEDTEGPTDDDLPTIVAMLAEMHEKAKELETAAAMRAQQRLKPGMSVPAAADNAIASARATLESVKQDVKGAPFVTQPATTET